MGITGRVVGIGGCLMGIALFSGGVVLFGQAAPSAPATEQTRPAKPEENPFPGEQPAAAAKPAAGGQSGTAQTRDGGAAKPATSDNPFPGEDTSVPVIPVAGEPGDHSAERGSARRDAGGAHDPDGDPVRSPDGADTPADDGFSSSRSGIKASDETVDDAKPVKTKTRAQQIKEDLDVGGFYADKRDWKGALGRYESAFKLDAENEDAIFGLAETERHMNELDKAKEHYELFLSYDPDGPHSKAARKALEQLGSTSGRAK